MCPGRDADGSLPIHVNRCQTGGGYALRGSIPLANLYGGIVGRQKGVHLLFQLDGEGVSSGEHAPQEAEVRVFQPIGPQQRLEQRRHAGDQVRLFFHEKVRIDLHIELGHQDAGSAANQRRMDTNAQSEAMEKRHYGEHFHIADIGIVARGGNGLHGQRIEIQIGEQNTLCSAGSATGIENGAAFVILAILLRQFSFILPAAGKKVRPEDVILLLFGKLF